MGFRLLPQSATLRERSHNAITSQTTDRQTDNMQRQ